MNASAASCERPARPVPQEGSQRLDYDDIAAFYDAHPYRAEAADQELAAFIAERDSHAGLTLLDIACGTGNQLIANHPMPPAGAIYLCLNQRVVQALRTTRNWGMPAESQRGPAQK